MRLLSNLRLTISLSTFIVFGLSFVCFFAIRNPKNVAAISAMELSFPNPNYEDDPQYNQFSAFFFFQVHSVAEISIGGTEINKKMALEQCRYHISLLETIKDPNAIIKVKYGTNFKYADFIKLADICLTMKAPAFADFDSCMIVRYVVPPWPAEGFSRWTSPVL